MSAFVQAPRQFVEAVAGLRLPPTADNRLRVLMDRNNNGQLSLEEREVLQTLAQLSEDIAIVRAHAIHVLGRIPA